MVIETETVKKVHCSFLDCLRILKATESRPYHISSGEVGQYFGPAELYFLQAGAIRLPEHLSNDDPLASG